MPQPSWKNMFWGMEHAVEKDAMISGQAGIEKSSTENQNEMILVLSFTFSPLGYVAVSLCESRRTKYKAH